MHAGGGHEPRVPIFDLAFEPLTMAGAVDRVFDGVRAGRGGLVLTANLDILRRSVVDDEARAIYRRADVVVADGMPLVWASRIAGTPLPERVAGSSLILELAARAAEEGRSIYLLGGDDDDGMRAAEALRRRYPGLRIAGLSSPRVGTRPTDDEVAEVAAELLACMPDLVLVALGSPKQEALALRLLDVLPQAWFMGVGISLAFLGGRVSRAPKVVQDLGLEWLHRLVQEPERLARRYLVDGLPFAARLFAHAIRVRAARGPS